MEYTITEIREINQYDGKRGLVYQFYCVVKGADGTEADVRIDAKSEGRWKVGSVCELEDKGYQPWERNGVAYTVVKASVPEHLRQQSNGQSRSFGAQRQQATAPRRGLSNGSANGAAKPQARMLQQPLANGHAKPTASPATKALSFEQAIVLYGRLSNTIPSEPCRAALFQAILNGKVTEPSTDFASNVDEDDAVDTGEGSADFFEGMTE